MLELGKNMPLLPGQNAGRAVTRVESDKLAEVGVNGSAFAIHKDDHIVFPDQEPLVVSQPISNDVNANKAYYVGVERNGKPSWLGIGILTRRDSNGQPIGKFQEKMCEKASFKDIYDSLKGKTLVGGELKSYTSAVFENGVRTDKTRERLSPEITCAGITD